MLFGTFLIKNLLRRPVRSLLTGVGVALAVGTVVALLGIAHSFETSFVQLYEKRGVDLIVVRAGVTQRLTSHLDEKIARRLREIAGVDKVTGALLDVVSFEHTSLIGVPVQGWPADSLLFNELKVLDGRRLQPADQRAVMLGSVLARNLDKKVGDTVEIEAQKFSCIGVYESFNVFENNSAVVLLADLQRLMDLPGQVTGFQVVVANIPNKQQAVERIRQQIKDMEDDEGESLRLSAMSVRESASSTLEIRLAHSMAWITSAIALVIGSIGMLNTMIMSVFERTHEIGILRAIGWRKGRIMGMILGESLMLCAAGAVLGVIGAVVLTRLLSSFPAAAGYLRGDIAPVIIAEGLGIALLVGLIGGIYPAYRGASLAPTEAIRHE